MTARHRLPVPLMLVTLAFFARGLFFCVQQPLWEGFDEWAHFACVQHFAETGRMPLRSDPVSVLVRRSLELAPLSPSGKQAATTGVTYREYRQLAPAERARRERELRLLTGNLAGRADSPKQYEAQQPPLYYALLALPYLALRHSPISTIVIALRILSLLLATAAVPLTYLLARRIAFTRRLALPLAALLAAFAGLVVNVSRIGNDGIAMTLSAVFALFLLRTWKCGGNGVLLGFVLAFALLTKAYFLAFVPILLVLAWRRRLAGSVALAIVLLGAGWWYAETWITTGSLSGEQVEAAARGGKFSAVIGANWLKVADSGLFTHIWTGGWSFLLLPRWMYRIFELLVAISGIGLLRLLWRRRPPLIAALAGLYALFCLGMAYHSLVIYQVYRLSTAPGWYFCAVAPVELILLYTGLTGLAGLRNAANTLVLTGLLILALDLYATHALSMPAYSGFALVPGAFTATWALYLCATIGIAVYLVRRYKSSNWSWVSCSARRRASGHSLTPAP